MTIRAALRVLGTPLRLLLLGSIGLYRLLSAGSAPRCKYYPTCSDYAQGAITVHGAGKGFALASWRLLRCNPLSRGGVDHVPPAGRAYDSLIHPAGGRL